MGVDTVRVFLGNANKGPMKLYFGPDGADNSKWSVRTISSSWGPYTIDSSTVETSDNHTFKLKTTCGNAIKFAIDEISQRWHVRKGQQRNVQHQVNNEKIEDDL